MLFLLIKKGKGKELKVLYHASAAATRDDHMTIYNIVPTLATLLL